MKRTADAAGIFQYRLSVRDKNNDVHRYEKNMVTELIVALFAERGFRYGQ